MWRRRGDREAPRLVCGVRLRNDWARVRTLPLDGQVLEEDEHTLRQRAHADLKRECSLLAPPRDLQGLDRRGRRQRAEQRGAAGVRHELRRSDGERLLRRQLKHLQEGVVVLADAKALNERYALGAPCAELLEERLEALRRRIRRRMPGRARRGRTMEPTSNERLAIALRACEGTVGAAAGAGRAGRCGRTGDDASFLR